MLAIGSDHGGFELKQIIMEHLKNRGIAYEDVGCYDRSACDYPLYGRAAAQAVGSGRCDRGIVICTTGIGISISANKVKGVRCALCSESLSARLTRQHNDANMLALAGGMLGPNLALDIVDTFLDTEFSGEERHCRRVELIDPEK